MSPPLLFPAFVSLLTWFDWIDVAFRFSYDVSMTTDLKSTPQMRISQGIRIISLLKEPFSHRLPPHRTQRSLSLC
ncbi:hypothetical protein B0F90DRAFT_1742845 [Multifurca ochricompacta]|uniref:Secreted protein n=1 Tax=Multifurca ochricompacta TaxID=376703 RepID=A0AAD4LZX1_9AGAM|nr:hypothetical protein B0F90DRAFT_1742845 [Multifurca ochricompacta]